MYTALNKTPEDQVWMEYYTPHFEYHSPYLFKYYNNPSEYIVINSRFFNDYGYYKV